MSHHAVRESSAGHRAPLKSACDTPKCSPIQGSQHVSSWNKTCPKLLTEDTFRVQYSKVPKLAGATCHYGYFNLIVYVVRYLKHSAQLACCDKCKKNNF